MTKPNILIIMSDEHAPMYSGVYGHPIVQTPNMQRLAEAGATFDAAYCNSPLCAPSRMSFMTGRFVHHIGAWDNVTPLRSDEVTWAHRLRDCGYDVALSGKQHFAGPDQLHGFQQQLARDLHAEWNHPIHTWDEGIRRPSSPGRRSTPPAPAPPKSWRSTTWRSSARWNICATRLVRPNPGR